MRNISIQNFLIIIFAALVCALTLVVRIPTPGTGGYLNFGDVGVIFCGLFLGKKRGALAAGIGSAAADLIGGFFIFIPITLIAKGLEGYIAGSFGKSSPWFFLPAAVVIMAALYFVAEVFLPGMGWSAAISALPFNLIQGAIGAVLGFFVFTGINVAFENK